MKPSVSRGLLDSLTIEKTDYKIKRLIPHEIDYSCNKALNPILTTMKQHIIFSLGRSGSNYLANFLNNHPQITNYGEVLGEWTVPYKLHNSLGLGRSNFEAYVDFIYSSRLFFYGGHSYSALSHLIKKKKIQFKFWKQVETIGIKDFSMNFSRRGLSSYLEKRQDIKIINLYRENILKRFISLEKMERSGVVALTKDTQNQTHRNQKIRLDTPYVLQRLGVFEQELNDHFDMLQNIPESRILNIRYEDLFLDAKRQAQYESEVLEFLGVSAINSESQHKKILSDNLRDIVENYDELERGLSNTRFEKYLS